jgi:hypothetical protein
MSEERARTAYPSPRLATDDTGTDSGNDGILLAVREMKLQRKKAMIEAMEHENKTKYLDVCFFLPVCFLHACADL